MTSPPEWLEAQADRVTARQRAQVDTAKLVATFAAGVAATLVATALQVGTPPTSHDLVATLGLGLVLFLTIAVVLADRITECDHEAVTNASLMHGWDQNRLIAELRTALLVAVTVNAGVVRWVQWALVPQLLLSMATTTLAAWSLTTGRG